MYNHIRHLAEECIDARAEQVEKLSSIKAWKNYLQKQQSKLQAPLAKFKKYDLNPQTIGFVNKDAYTVEKLVYESHPGFFVTASLFIPTDRKFPLPTIFYAVGHSQTAFRRDVYQISILNLVKKGFIVFTIDPIGQGERTQYLDSITHKSRIGGTTHEHSYAGGQCFMTGYSINDYFVWDGIRGLDYLSKRSEVDTTRIGMTGRSGGGQQTAVLAAIDERIYAAAPECYITNHRRLFESIGPQDAEQNIYQVLKLGLDHPDFLSVRVPKPTLMVTTTEDFFSIQGARETYREAKQVYQQFGKPNHLTMVESPGFHASTQANRESMYRFFQQHLDLPGDSSDAEVELLTCQELQITSTGQVSTSFGSKSVFELNQQVANSLVTQRTIKTPQDLMDRQPQLLDKAYRLSGMDTTRTFGAAVYTGTIQRENYRIEKYFLESKDVDYPLPFVIIKPDTGITKATLLFVGSQGKQELVDDDEQIRNYVQQGYTIVAPDLTGTGELKNPARGDAFIQGYSYNLWVGANLVSKTIAGFQASDLDVLFNYLQNASVVPTNKITAVVKDEAISSYLHFALFHKEAIQKTILINPLISYQNIINTQYYQPRYLWTAVPEAVQHYDLEYLMACLSPSALYLINPVDATGKPVDARRLASAWNVLEAVFKARQATLQIDHEVAENSLLKTL
ncbi:MAG: acetylxylan esterase [Tunicatimonas sp.]